MTTPKEKGGAPPKTDAFRAKSGVGSGSLEPLSNGSVAWLPLDMIHDTDFNRDPGNLDSLKKSIGENGLITPLACAPDGRLLAGRRRFAVLKDLGWEKAPFLVIQPEDEAHSFRIMLDENVERKPFTDPEMASVIKEFDELMRGKHGEQPQGGRPSNNQGAAPEFWSQKKTADILGVDQKTVSRAIKVAELVEANPEWAHLKGKQILREAKIQQQIAEIEEAVKRPDGLFDVISCDPPWPYCGGTYDPDDQRGVPPYPTMEIEEIASIEIPAKENCVLWLWGINRILDKAFIVARAWGFEPKTVLTWVKGNFGTGRWLRGQTEHVILAIKGSVPWRLSNQSTVIHGPLREHSRKPNEFYDLVDTLCHGRKLDMFSREKREGWDQWGDEVDRF